MKTLKLKMIVIASLVTVIISLLLSSFMAPPQDDIVGTWISNDDELWKITFTLSGERKDYYENVLVETTSYQIMNTCGSLTRSNNELFLKTIGQMGQNEVVCDLFNGIHTDENGLQTLSLTSERGKLYLFTKQ
jgi:hypothetical protein